MNKKRMRELQYLLFATKAKRIIVNIAFFMLMFSLCFLILQPFFNKLSLSLMSQADLADSTVVSLPRMPTLDNFKFVWELLRFNESLPFTAGIALATGLMQTVSSFLVGYGFARYSFPLKKFWFACVLLLIILPSQCYSIPLYLQFRFFDVFGIIRALTGKTINLVGSVWPLLLLGATSTGLKNGLYIYLFYQHFRNVPRDLEEAAYLDGCGAVRTLFKIMLPDAIPLATSCMLFSFVWQWTDHRFTNLLLGSDIFLATRLNGMQQLIDVSGGASLVNNTATRAIYGDCLTATATLLMLIPVVILYLFGQKRFVESLNFSGMKM